MHTHYFTGLIISCRVFPFKISETLILVTTDATVMAGIPTPIDFSFCH